MCVGRPGWDLLQLQIDQRCDGSSYRSNFAAHNSRARPQAGFHDYVAKFDRPGLIAALKEHPWLFEDDTLSWVLAFAGPGLFRLLLIMSGIS